MKLQHADSPDGPWLDVPLGQAPTRPYLRRLDETPEERGDRGAHELLEQRRAERRSRDGIWNGVDRRGPERRGART